MSSGNLGKYEYFVLEDLNYKSSTAEQAKFDHSPLNKFLNKGLEEEDKKEGLLKRLKNTEDKKVEQLKGIKNKTEDIKEFTYFVEEPPSLETNALIEEFKIIQKDVDYKKLKITGDKNVTYNFSDFKALKSYLERFITEICQ